MPESPPAHVPGLPIACLPLGVSRPSHPPPGSWSKAKKRKERNWLSRAFSCDNKGRMRLQLRMSSRLSPSHTLLIQKATGTLKLLALVTGRSGQWSLSIFIFTILKVFLYLHHSHTKVHYKCTNNLNKILERDRLIPIPHSGSASELLGHTAESNWTTLKC